MNTSKSYYWLYIGEDGHQAHAVEDHHEAVEDNPHLFGMDLHDVEVVRTLAYDVEQQGELLVEAAMNASWSKVTLHAVAGIESPRYVSLAFASDVIGEVELWKALIWFGRHHKLTHRDALVIRDIATETCDRRLFGDIQAAYATRRGSHTTGRATGEL